MKVFCNSTNNKMKEQVRTRKYLYDDGSETNNTRLCSNELAIITEQKCLPAKTQQITRKTIRQLINNALSFTMTSNQTYFFPAVISVVLILVFVSLVFFYSFPTY